MKWVSDARDAVSKALYGRLFGWIVNKINQLLAPKDQSSVEAREIGGCLDIHQFVLVCLDFILIYLCSGTSAHFFVYFTIFKNKCLNDMKIVLYEQFLYHRYSGHFWIWTLWEKQLWTSMHKSSKWTATIFL